MIDVARGGFLSDNDRSVLDRFPVEIAAEDLIRCFSLGERDLESCVLYKQALDQHLPPEISDIVMSVNSGEDGYANYRRDRDAEETGMAIWISNHKATIASEITNTNRSGYLGSRHQMDEIGRCALTLSGWCSAVGVSPAGGCLSSWFRPSEVSGRCSAAGF